MLKFDREESRFLTAVGSVPRLKILISLWKSKKELSIYRICRNTGLGRSAVNRHVKMLVEAKLVSRRIYGGIPLYSLDTNQLKTKALIVLFKSTVL